MYYESLMVITKNNPITYTQMIKRRKHTRTKKNHQLTETARKDRGNYETIRKQLTKWQ